jgi:hypothetical protein
VHRRLGEIHNGLRFTLVLIEFAHGPSIL